MTMDDPTGFTEQVDDELAARLDTYADAVLAPDPAGLTRVRASVVAEARRAAEGDSRSSVGSFLGGLLPGIRRPAFVLVGAAALLAVVAGGAMAASGAGGPLYETRLWLETVVLPSEPGARTDAEIARLQDRLEEAAAAASEGNGAAISAALQAYRDTVDATVTAAGGDLGREEHLQLVLERHRVVLQTLVTMLDSRAQATDSGSRASEAIQRVLAKNAETIDRIVDNAAPAGEPGGSPSAPGQGQGGKPSEPPGQGAGPGQGGANPASPGKSEPPGQGGGKPSEPPGQVAPGPGGQSAPTERPSKSPKPTTP
jgi:hypothetical protein